jgi:drug/metabolite transporter (DMT)-like permease
MTRSGRAFRPHAASEAYAFLVFTMACWGGNAVAGRIAVGEVSPMVITCLRWAIVSILLIGIKPHRLVQAWPELRRNGRKIAVMAVCGFTSFNALFYVAAHHTTAVNIAILQGAIPVFVVLGTVILYGARIGAVQALGIAATIIGVAVVTTEGRPGALALLQFNFGDALMLLACFLYSGYTLALRDRPNVPNLVFFTALAFIAFLTSLPLLAYEVTIGAALWPTPAGWALLFFIALFPSFLAQLAFMRGVQLIGPGRAGLFANLAPVFGALLAVLILSEPFGLFHLVALVLVVGGILLAETAGRIRAAPLREVPTSRGEKSMID